MHRLSIPAQQTSIALSKSNIIPLDKQTQTTSAGSMIDEEWLLTSRRCRFEERPCPHTELPPSRPVRSASSALQHSQSTTNMHHDNQAELPCLVSTATRHRHGDSSSRSNVPIKQTTLTRQIKNINSASTCHCTRLQEANITETLSIRRPSTVNDAFDRKLQSVSQRIVSSGFTCSINEHLTGGSPISEALCSERLRTQQLCKELCETRKRLLFIEEQRLLSTAAMHSLHEKRSPSRGSDQYDDETTDEMLPPEPEQLPDVTKLRKCSSQLNPPCGAGRRWQRRNSMPSLKPVPKVDWPVATCSVEVRADSKQTGSDVEEYVFFATVPHALREARRVFVHAQLARLAFEGGA